MMTHNGQKSVTWLLLGLLIFTTACNKEGEFTLHFEASPELLRKQLPSVHTGQGLTGRTAVSIGQGTFVLLHHPLQGVEAPNLEQLLGRNTAEPDDDGMIVEDEADLWVEAANDCATSFNCCTYAVGADIGLTPYDWVQPIATESTLMINPMQTILENCYKVVCTYQLNSQETLNAYKSLEGRDDIFDGDVACFVRGSGDSVRFLHAGRIKKKSGRNWLVSKMGAGPIVISTIERTAAYYELSASDSLQIHRFHGSSSRRNF